MLSAVAVLSLVLFAVLLIVVWHMRGPIGVDRALDGATRQPNVQLLSRLARLGSEGFVFLGVAAVAVVAYACRDKPGVAICVVGPALAAVCELIAKPVVHRMDRYFLSYPSGHATLSASLAALIVVVAYRLGGARAAAVAAVPAAVLPLLVSVAVVRLRWHYPTDAIGGVALGVGVVCAMALAVGQIPQKSDELVKAD